MARRFGRLEASCLAALLLFAAFSTDLLLGGPLTQADLRNSLWVRGHMQPQLTQLLLFVTHWHGTVGILAMSGLLGVLLFVTGRGRDIPWMLLVVQGGQLVNVAVKSLFQRARPQWDEPLLTLTTFSFPSGHAVASTVFWGFAYVVAREWPVPAHVRRAILALCIVMVGLSCFSRVYLGAHFVSDVLAGVCEGAAWLLACLVVRKRLARGSGATIQP